MKEQRMGNWIVKASRTVMGKFLVGLVSKNDVVSNGIQTSILTALSKKQFENDVVSNGNQTEDPIGAKDFRFENDVVSNGNQTYSSFSFGIK